MKWTKILLGVALSISFFMPWFDAVVDTVSGARFPTLIGELGGIGGNLAGFGLLKGLYFLPVLGVLTAILAFRNQGFYSRIAAFVSGSASLLYMVVLLTFSTGDMVDAMMYGVLYTFIAGLSLLLVSAMEGSSTEAGVKQIQQSA
ncbi:hypothetical protein LCM10_12080 [Rossellomorea aquimaris]|uniref:hypothetical protein n=1 Tax=Rossellomorea aquimaris TaxID=189382 RepID=UPI001CD63B6B|nr:hypothetical protein [Rossellomorea aquimaris]MCA1055725.1 hypothetical protein [Rossellomorea aquimaris]